ncbi:hypothetical protein HanPI659440_Chr04g0175671 [Helianthus annuus]|nr:hypothetical protein HanPI659440_Chr04g0175671 [Helianthus annuus]
MLFGTGTPLSLNFVAVGILPFNALHTNMLHFCAAQLFQKKSSAISFKLIDLSSVLLTSFTAMFQIYKWKTLIFTETTPTRHRATPPEYQPIT